MINRERGREREREREREMGEKRRTEKGKKKISLVKERRH